VIACNGDLVLFHAAARLLAMQFTHISLETVGVQDVTP
jgi:hypothetical protein